MCAMIGSSHFLALRTNSSCRQASKQFGDQEGMTKERGPDKVSLAKSFHACSGACLDLLRKLFHCHSLPFFRSAGWPVYGGWGSKYGD